jgi:hypothetical protein
MLKYFLIKRDKEAQLFKLMKDLKISQFNGLNTMCYIKTKKILLLDCDIEPVYIDLLKYFSNSVVVKHSRGNISYEECLQQFTKTVIEPKVEELTAGSLVQINWSGKPRIGKIKNIQGIYAFVVLEAVSFPITLKVELSKLKSIVN